MSFVESRSHFDSDGDNTAQAVKTSGGRIHAIAVANKNNADAFIQFFDTAAASVTVGTTTPVFSILVPKGDGTLYGQFDTTFTFPVKFNAAITYACTTTPTGSGDPSTGLTVNIFYS